MLFYASLLMVFERLNEEDPALDELYLGVVLTCVVVITGVFSYYQRR